MPDHPTDPMPAELMLRASRAIDEACPNARDSQASRERALRVAFKRARGHGLSADVDLITYAVAMYRHTPNFDQQPEIAAALVDPSHAPAERWHRLFTEAFEAAWQDASRPNFFDGDYWQDPDLLAPPSRTEPARPDAEGAGASDDDDEEIDDEAWGELLLALKATQQGGGRTEPPSPQALAQAQAELVQRLGDRARERWVEALPPAHHVSAATLRARQCAPGELRPDVSFERPGPPVQREDLDALRAALQIDRLPADYESYLLRWNGAWPCVEPDAAPHACRVVRVWWPVGATAAEYGRSSSIGSFGKVNGDPAMGQDLLCTHRDIGHLMPPQVFILASGDGGNRFLLDLRPERFGQVLFWSYLAIGNEDMFAENPYHNVGWVGHNLHDFINRMEVEFEDEDEWLAQQPPDEAMDWQPR